jgi:hypothetical protein
MLKSQEKWAFYDDGQKTPCDGQATQDVLFVFFPQKANRDTIPDICLTL